jgi:crotonobetainyl-CoA:carnitine CoA-transferase CaiB-like acyl-CoA transferase
MSSAILEGIRVVDMTQYLAGPTVTRLLAEMGADIVKIEQPPHGDPSRSYAVVNDGRSGYFVQQNRGKKSLCIDVDQPAGRQVLDGLLAKADIFVENYGPGVLERRGLDWASLRDRYPRLIMASVSGYGREGAMSDRVAFDLIAQAQSGIMHVTGTEDGPPLPVGTSIGDVGAGVHAAAAIGFALFHRERTGAGQHLDIAMVDSLFHMHELGIQGPPLTGMRWQPSRSGHRSRLNAPLGAFEGPDGWVVIQVMERQWPGFCRAMGRPELEHDERFADIRNRQRHRDELNALIEDWARSFATNDDLIAALDAERVPCAKVLSPVDALGHPHFESRQVVRRVPDPILGEVVIPASPLRFSAQPEPLDLVAPLLGEHNEGILAELGYDDDARATLIAERVIVSGDR